MIRVAPMVNFMFFLIYGVDSGLLLGGSFMFFLLIYVYFPWGCSRGSFFGALCCSLLLFYFSDLFFDCPGLFFGALCCFFSFFDLRIDFPDSLSSFFFFDLLFFPWVAPQGGPFFLGHCGFSPSFLIYGLFWVGFPRGIFYVFFYFSGLILIALGGIFLFFFFIYGLILIAPMVSFWGQFLLALFFLNPIDS
ncbi:MAG: hypothetical protein H0A75_03520 [Candidatus Methanofishera endochildressiae]|uniref:Uncharacterized protein n=1 Tax=Candidatus Methanofishera endochildressiae TaxID=2738884 RepID=A0A7Z0MNU9_9GAMM|nr:hypothetical protein [Candidatus Methanofishera endochildressiae]